MVVALPDTFRLTRGGHSGPRSRSNSRAAPTVQRHSAQNDGSPDECLISELYDLKLFKCRHTAPAFDMAVAMTRPASRRRPEIGVVFEHDGLVRQVREVLADETSPPKSYRVVTEDGEIIWLDRAAEPARIWREEPEAAIWRRPTATILGFLPIFQAARQLRSVRR